MRTTYEIVTADPDSGRPFAEMMLPGWPHGEPLGLVIHRQGNPIPDDDPSRGAHALAAIRWGSRTKAFSIHWYVDGERAYACVPEDRHAYHVREHREAANRGRPVYRSTWMARTPEAFTERPNGQFAGASRPRGDIGQIGIEVVDRMRPDGSIYFDQASRITLVLLARDILVRRAHARADWLRDLYAPITGHATWDHWTRPDDPGQALYLPDFVVDVLDLATGRTPWRTVGDEYDGSRPVGDRESPEVGARELALVRGHIDEIRELLRGG